MVYRPENKGQGLWFGFVGFSGLRVLGLGSRTLGFSQLRGLIWVRRLGSGGFPWFQCFFSGCSMAVNPLHLKNQERETPHKGAPICGSGV